MVKEKADLDNQIETIDKKLADIVSFLDTFKNLENQISEKDDKIIVPEENVIDMESRIHALENKPDSGYNGKIKEKMK